MTEYTLGEYFISFICDINRGIKNTLSDFTFTLNLDTGTILLLNNLSNNLCSYD